MEKNIEIKNAEKKDLDILYRMSIEFSEYNVKGSGNRDEIFMEGWEIFFREEIESALSDKNSVYFIAWYDDSPVGYVYGQNCERCWKYVIEELFVDESYRGMHIGEELLNKAIEFGKQFETPLTVEVFDWNKQALNFYLKKGFKIESLVLTRK